MCKFRKYICAFFFMWSFWTLLIPVRAQEAAQVQASGDELQLFLDWYAMHKDTGGEYFLSSELHLSTGTPEAPIVLDGSGEIYLYCNQYSLIIESEVIIDNKNLFIFSKDNEQPAVILGDMDGAADARLILKNGTVTARSAVGLSVVSGELICPQGENRFSINSWLESPTALTIIPSGITLSNLDLSANGKGAITGINGGSQLELQNCTVTAEAEEADSGIVTGIKVDDNICLSRTSVIARGNNAKSIVCTAGTNYIKADSECTVEPEFAKPPDSDAKYRVTRILNPVAVNVPVGVSPDVLELPELLECEMMYSDDDITQAPNRTIAVEWDTENLASRLQEEGECVVSGSFSMAQLEAEYIYLPPALQPTITVRVIPATAMNRIWFSQIEANQTSPFVEIYMQRPYGAQSLFIEYSHDGELWERGFCVRKADNLRESNILLYEVPQATTLTVPVYLSEINSSTRIRAVVTDGPFAGTWEPVLLDPDNLFTRPGEDGGGGDRGGGGMNEPGRDPSLAASQGNLPAVGEAGEGEISLDSVPASSQTLSPQTSYFGGRQNTPIKGEIFDSATKKTRDRAAESTAPTEVYAKPSGSDPIRVGAGSTSQIWLVGLVFALCALIAGVSAYLLIREKKK